MTYHSSESTVDLDFVSLFDGDIAADSSITSVYILTVLVERIDLTFDIHVHVGRTIGAFLNHLHNGVGQERSMGYCRVVCVSGGWIPRLQLSPTGVRVKAQETTLMLVTQQAAADAPVACV